MTTAAGSLQIVPQSPPSTPARRAADQGVADALDSVLSDNTRRVYAGQAAAQWRLFNDWCDLVGWLQEAPDASAVALLNSAGCKRRNRIDSAGRTCVHCNGGCSSGEASWPTSWSMPRPKQRCRTPMECRK